MARSKERAIAGVTSGQIGLDQEVTWEGRHFGIKWHMTSRITELDKPHRFVDEMVKGPFKSYRHEHLFVSKGDNTRMTDVIEFSTPGGPFRRISDALVGMYLEKLIAARNVTIKQEAETSGLAR